MGVAKLGMLLGVVATVLLWVAMLAALIARPRQPHRWMNGALRWWLVGFALFLILGSLHRWWTVFEPFTS